LKIKNLLDGKIYKVLNVEYQDNLPFEVWLEPSRKQLFNFPGIQKEFEIVEEGK